MACAAGSRPSVSSGSAPIGVQARRVDDHQAALQQRVRIVDQRVAPGRHLDAAVVAAAAGCPAGGSSLQKPSAAAVIDADPARARHLGQRLGQAVGVARIQARGAARPRAASRSSASDCAAQPRVDRQQRQLGGCPACHCSSTGHIVVRPGVAGSTRRPVSAKKMALISSDLPRENSATKASTSLSLARRCGSASSARRPTRRAARARPGNGRELLDARGRARAATRQARRVDAQEWRSCSSQGDEPDDPSAGLCASRPRNIC